MRVGLTGVAAALATLMLAGGCTQTKPALAPVVVVIDPAKEPEWLGIVSPEDQDRLKRTGEAWSAALKEARDKGFGRSVRDEGVLLRPDAALPRPAPSPGTYHCRTIKLGTQGKSGTKGKGKSGPAFVAYKPFYCHVEAEGPLLSITKQTGSQRPGGWLYADSDEKKLVFLGTLALGTEEAPLAYRQNPDRDMAGFFERVAPFRYRLVIPWPRTESKLDVIELTPVTE